MPTVPRAQRQVQDAPLPSARVSTGGTTAETFGGGASLDKVSGAVSDIADIGLRIQAETRAQADELKVQDADTLQEMAETDILKGIQGMQGKNAVSSIDYMNDEWTKRNIEIEKTLTNDRQKSAFRKVSAQRYGSLYKTTNGHMAREFETYKDQSYTDNVIASQTSAALHYQEPERIERSLLQQEAATARYAERKGLSKESYNKLISEARNKTHVNVLNRMLSDGRLDMASPYYEKNKGEIEPAESSKFETSIASYGKADEILQSSKNMVEAQEKILSIPDEKVREKVEKQVKVGFQRRNFAYNTQEEKIASLMFSGETDENISTALEQAYKAGGISEENYRVAKNSILDGFAKESEESELVGLMLQYSKINSADDPVSKVMEFRNEVLVKKGKLSESHFNQFLEWSGSKKIEVNKPKMNGLQKFAQFYMDTVSFKPIRTSIGNLMGTIGKYMNDEYKPGKIVSRGGKNFEVTQNEDGSVGFKELK